MEGWTLWIIVLCFPQNETVLVGAGGGQRYITAVFYLLLQHSFCHYSIFSIVVIHISTENRCPVFPVHSATHWTDCSWTELNSEFLMVMQLYRVSLSVFEAEKSSTRDRQSYTEGNYSLFIALLHFLLGALFKKKKCWKLLKRGLKFAKKKAGNNAEHSYFDCVLIQCVCI